MPPRAARALAPDLLLPVTLLTRYLFFLQRRPVSSSNSHFLARRLAGLRSLRGLLAGRDPRLDPAASLLGRMTPANLGRLGPDLQRLLLPLLPPELPPGAVLSRRPPGEAFFRDVRKVLLLLGPGIGIGDEILCFSLPRRLAASLPGAEVTVLSAYPGLWAAAPGAPPSHRCRCYESHAELVASVRGEGPEGAFDLVAMADFEKPALLHAMAHEPAVPRYVEISLGARAAWALDCGGRWLHEHQPPPYADGYYSCLRRLADWLLPGETPSPSLPRFAGEGASAPAGPEPAPGPLGPLTVFVSPFTSKQEPAEEQWSRLLPALVPDGPGSVRFVFDPGANRGTERFALALARAARGGAAAGTACELPLAEGGRSLSLRGVLGELARADAVVCADSFVAHAAPLFGCTTLVLAGPGLEAWRVPGAQSYYFDGLAPAATVAEGMRLVLAEMLARRRRGRRPPAPAVSELVRATRRLGEALDAAPGGEPGPLRCYEELFQAYRLVVADLPAGLASLLQDRDYDRLLAPLPRAAAAGGRGGASELLDYLRHQLDIWEGSNLWKFLGG